MSKLEIIHENKDYIVVNKLSGRISEKSPFEDGTVEDQVLEHLLLTKPKPFIGVIHRLDRVTSGVLIFAKKKGSLVAFNHMFSNRTVQKTYLAIVSKHPQKEKGILNHFLVKNKEEKRATIVSTKTKEAQACSLSYKLIGQNHKGYLLEVKPKTGRFHQIRAQLAHIDLPIIGDHKYGSDLEYKNLSVCLHAWKLSFKDAVSNETINYEAPLPNNQFWEFPDL